MALMVPLLAYSRSNPFGPRVHRIKIYLQGKIPVDHKYHKIINKEDKKQIKIHLAGHLKTMSSVKDLK
jgi:hypothetical protein